MYRRRCIGIIRALSALAALGTASTHADEWFEVRAGDYTIVTNAGAAAARHTLREIEAFHFGVSELLSRSDLRAGIAVRIHVLTPIASRRYADLSRSRAGFATTDLLALHAVVLLKKSGDEWPRGTLQHALYHVLADSGDLSALPLWWNEGMAELLGSTRLIDEQIVIGTLGESRRQWRHLAWRPIEQLVAIDAASLGELGPVIRNDFHVQANATMHYFMIARPDLEASMQDYLAWTRAGHASVAAFRQAFGPDLQHLQAEIRRYSEGWFRQRNTCLVYDARLAPRIGQAAERQLTSEEAMRSLGLTLLMNQRYEAAIRVLNEVLESVPDDAWSSALLARAYDQTDRNEEADRLIEFAITHAGNDAQTLRACGDFFLYRANRLHRDGATLTAESRALLGRAKALYRAALQHDPRAREVAWSLGNAIVADPDDDALTELLSSLRSLQSELPPRAQLDGLIADLLRLDGQLPAARQQAQRALLHSRGPDASARALARLELIDRELAGAVPAPAATADSPR